MAKSDSDIPRQGTAASANTCASLLPTAKQEIEFSLEHGLVAWNAVGKGRSVLQIIMPSASAALALKSLIQLQNGPINDVVVRKSPTQRNQWVVQLPLSEAHAAQLLPGSIAISKASETLPTVAPGNALAAMELRKDWIRLQSTNNLRK